MVAYVTHGVAAERWFRAVPGRRAGPRCEQAGAVVHRAERTVRVVIPRRCLPRTRVRVGFNVLTETLSGPLVDDWIKDGIDPRWQHPRLSGSL